MAFSTPMYFSAKSFCLQRTLLMKSLHQLFYLATHTPRGFILGHNSFNIFTQTSYFSFAFPASIYSLLVLLFSFCPSISLFPVAVYSWARCESHHNRSSGSSA